MSLQRAFVALAALTTSAAFVTILALPGCSADPEVAPAGDFCGVASKSNGKCTEPSACDTQLAKDCGSLPKALASGTVTAAKDCLESGICGVASCVSRGQKGATPSGAHKVLAENFCKFCAPNLQDCEAGFYKRGTKAAGLMVLPYSDEIVKAVDEACTGEPGCQAKFTQCASGVITSAVGERLDPATADCVVAAFTNDEPPTPVGPDGKPQVVTCTAANCTGCCRDDKCEKGDLGSACGAGGKSCEICAQTSECKAGACKEPCGPNTCNGCCDGDNCVDGTAKDKCGEKGAKCGGCAGTFICSNKTCIDGSCKATCTNGCCSATGCKPGTAANACGTGGEGCVDCGVGRTCSSAACVLDRNSLWDVYISFAVLPELNKAGVSWDPLAGAPDPFLTVYTSEGASVHSGSTSTLTDTTIPFWAETPVKGIKASELLANTSIEIKDYDPFDFDDFIGGCQLPLTPAIFDGSLRDHVCPATPSGVSVKVYFRINPHVP